MIQAIIFDCFGVIITDALEQLLQRAEGTDPKVRERVVDMVHAANRGYIDPKVSSERIGRLLGMSYEQYGAAISEGEIKDERVTDWIRSLRKRYKTAMLSNIGRGSMAKRFSAEELAELFDVVAISGDLGIAKPDREIYEYTAERLGVPTTACVFIDDREGHLAGAKVAGMQTVLYENLSQAQADLKKIIG